MHHCKWPEMTQIAHSSVLNKSCKRTVFGLLQHHNKIFQFLKNKSEGGLLVLVIKAKDIAVADIRGHSRRPPPPKQPKIFSISCSFWEIFGKIVGWRPSCMVGAPSYGESWIKICLQPCVIYFSKTLHNIFKSQLCINILTSALTFCKAKYCFQTCNLVVYSGSDNQANSTSSADYRPFLFCYWPCTLYELSTQMLIWQNFFEYLKNVLDPDESEQNGG